MNTIIFYRSTYRGNTRRVAESIAEVLSARLVSIDHPPEIDLSAYDLIGFGSAIHFAAHDIRLQRFVASQHLEGKSTFLFSTRCRPLLGNYHKALRRIVREQGGHVVGEFSCRGYDRTGPWTAIDGWGKGRPNERDLFRAKLFADRLRWQLHPLSGIWRAPVAGHHHGVPLRPNGAETIAGRRTVFLNTTTCTGCGKCSQVCPMHLFEQADDGKAWPIHDNHCIQCRLCADRCPTSSIFVRETLRNGLRIALLETFSNKLQKRYRGEE